MENPGFIDGINSDELDRQKTIDAAKKKLKAFKMKQSSPTPRPSPTEPQHEDTSSPVPNRDSVNAPSSSSSRPNSHHRRRSSVSTRRESAEMMGIAAATLAELPSSDENEKDSRRRALWALEGKSSSPRDSFVSGFAKVEIPDFPSPDEEIVDRLTKPAFTGPTSIAARRESFGRTLTPSLSSKDQLHTLVEEDEEDDETPSAPTPRTRPPNLNLRPLTLDATSLPSPSLTPSPRIGLKPLTLVQSTAALQNSTMRSNVPNDMLPVKRHSSISYKRSNDPQPARVVSPVNNGAASLPTPDLTPTTTGRPMSPAEESFLYHSHATLLARIADLERAVACRTRPLSFASVSSRLSISSTTSDPPSDEMLSLVKDLKEERDELTREVASWRSQVENLEKQKDTLTRRVEAERRDAWVAQEKVAVVEAEKVALKKDLTKALEEKSSLEAALGRSDAALEELEFAYSKERARAEAAEREVERLLSTPRTRTDPFQPSFRSSSVASIGSSTDVDQDYSPPSKKMMLHPVEEEEEDNDSDEFNELAHYEDDDDAYSDASFPTSNTASSIFSLRSTSHLNVNAPLDFPVVASLPSLSVDSSTPTPPSTPSPPPASHARSNSLQRDWSFSTAPTRPREPVQIDRFFGCLDALDDSPSNFGSSFIVPSSSKDGERSNFFSGLDEDEDDDLPPFIIPAQERASIKSSPNLDVVLEEEEEEEEEDISAPAPVVPEPRVASVAAPQRKFSLTRKPVPAIKVEEVSVQPTSLVTRKGPALSSSNPAIGRTASQPVKVSPPGAKKQSPSSAVSKPQSPPVFTPAIPKPPTAAIKTPPRSHLSAIPTPSKTTTTITTGLPTPTSLPRVKPPTQTPTTPTKVSTINTQHTTSPTRLPTFRMSEANNTAHFGKSNPVANKSRKFNVRSPFAFH